LIFWPAIRHFILLVLVLGLLIGAQRCGLSPAKMMQRDWRETGGREILEQPPAEAQTDHSTWYSPTRNARTAPMK
jgi:hypothetical protein